MGIAPVNIARVSHNLRSFNLLNTLRASQVDLFRLQNQLSTGLRFQAPSEDPVRASNALRVDGRLDLVRSVTSNVDAANRTLRDGEAAMQEAVELIREAHTLAIEAASDTLSADERQALAVVVDSLIDKAVALGNRKHLDTYLFSGHYGSDDPFELTEEGVLFRGDDGRLHTIVDTDLSEDSFTISGREFFNAVSAGVQGFVDLDPALTPQTRLSDLNGATGRGVTPGSIMVTSGAEQVRIDLAGADTVGDVLDKINAELPAGLTASPTERSIRISGSADFTVMDIPGGTTARELGIYSPSPTRDMTGEDVDPRLTLRTNLKDLSAGAGVDLTNGIVIRNGGREVPLDFSTAATLEDVLNIINHSPAQVWAQIAPDGKTLMVRNRLSGADLTIEENGGQAATALGIRSMYEGTRLSELNDGRGLHTVDGDDFRIVTADGTNVDVDLDDLNLTTATIQDVVDLINTEAAGAVTATLTSSGNGIRILDNTSGGGALRIERLNVSPAIDGLGLDVAASGNLINGRDVNPVRVDSPFTAMLELRAALDTDDGQGVGFAAERLNRVLKHMQEVQGKLASKAAAMEDRAARLESESGAAQVLLSDVRDVDLGEAIVRFQQVQTALQANLLTASQVTRLTLMDYLR